MKLRFGIDAAAHERIRARLDGLCDEPPVGRRLSYVYLDTPDGALATRGVALRFRRSAALGTKSPGRTWRRQVIWSKRRDDAGRSLKALGIKHLKQRLDGSFNVRIERWTWQARDDWARISLDQTEVLTGGAREDFVELRIVCKRKHADDAMHFAVELGAMHLSSIRARERGLALLAGARSESPK